SSSAILSRNLNLFTLDHPTPHRGKYTASITNNESGPSLPGGTGFATMSVAANGAVVLTGKFGDGTPFSAGTSLNRDDIVPLYVRAYSRKVGYLAGQIAFRITDTSDANGSLTWHKPAQPNDAYYPAGFTTTPTFLATRYRKPPNFAFLGLGYNAILTLAEKPPKQLRHLGGFPPFTMLAPLRLGDKSKVQFNPLTGLFRGSYFDAGIPYTVRGAIYQYSPAYGEGLSFDQNGTSHVSITPYYGP